MKTFAYRDGDEYVINGEKHYTTGGAQADLLLLYARIDKKAPISQGMSLFVVPTNTPGVSASINDRLSNPILLNVNPYFENVRIPARYLVGEKNKGYSYFLSCRANMINYNAPALGACRRI
jgi:hypothetical protein